MTCENSVDSADTETLSAPVVAALIKSLESMKGSIQPGSHFVDETITLRVVGSVKKLVDTSTTVQPDLSYPVIFARLFEILGVGEKRGIEALTNAVRASIMEKDTPTRTEALEKVIDSQRKEFSYKKPRAGNTTVVAKVEILSK